MHDAKFALRQLVKNPGFTAVAVLTLALGIGANTSIFSLINAAMLKALPVKNPESIVLLGSRGKEDNKTDFGFYYPVFRKLREQNQFFDDVAAFASVPLNVRIDGQPNHHQIVRLVIRQRTKQRIVQRTSLRYLE